MRFFPYFRYLAFALTLVPVTAAQTPIGVNQSGAGYTVDFNNQDIRVVLSALAEAAGVNVTFSNLPGARTTLRLGQPVSTEQLLEVMRSIAEQNQLTMTTQGALIRIAQAGEPGDEADKALKEGTVQFYAYRLKHANAAQLAPVLMNLFTGQAVGAQVGGAGRRGRGDRLRAALQAQVQALTDSGAGDGRMVRRDSLQQILNGMAGGNGAGAAASQVRVVAEEASNTLLIRATAEEWVWIQQILAEVDLRPLQVLIEAVIVEVTRTRDLNVGVDATVTHRAHGQRAIADLPQTPNARDFLLQLAGGRGTIDFTAALTALATRGDLRIRSLPVIVGQNNKQAVLNVGSSRPFVSVSQTVPNDPTGRVQTTQYIDVGTKLQITPRINADGYVNLEVAQTANTATNEIQFDAPVISKREATTQIFLRDGQTTVLGGLADHTRDESRTGIPLLRDLPLLGGLFGSTHKSSVETELYVFLTPHIIAVDADIDRLRDSLQQHSPELRRDPVVPVFPGPLTTPTPAPAPVPAPVPAPTPKDSMP